MCKLFIASKKVGEDENLRKIINAQLPEFDKEKDGIGALVIGADRKIKTMRSMFDYEKVYDFVFDELDEAIFVAIHTRTGTSGVKDLLNVHFFNSGGYYFAHNGFVSDYFTKFKLGYNTGYSHGGSWKDPNDYSMDDLSLDNLLYAMDRCKKCSDKKACNKHEKELEELTSKKYSSKKAVSKEDKCDSLQFLENIPKPLTKEIVEAEVEKRSFSGMGLFVSEDTKDIKVIIKKKCYIIYEPETTEAVILTSYNPETKWNEYEIKTVLGIDALVSEKKQELKNKPLPIIEGVYTLAI